MADEVIPRAVPRWPGPKNTWDAWLTSSTNEASELIASNVGGFDYWIDVISVVQYQSAVGSEGFSTYFFNPNVPGSQQKNFWGGVVSSNTGVAFRFDGPFRIYPGDTLFFFNQGGFFFVYAQGFITSVPNEL